MDVRYIQDKLASNIRIVMADKDSGEHEIIKSSLPNASVLICLFHILKSFRREVSCEKMGITSRKIKCDSALY